MAFQLLIGIFIFTSNFHFYLGFPLLLGISIFPWNFHFYLEFLLFLAISTFAWNFHFYSEFTMEVQICRSKPENRHFDTLYLGGNVHLLIIFSVLGTPFLENFEIDLPRQFIIEVQIYVDRNLSLKRTFLVIFFSFGRSISRKLRNRFAQTIY